MVGAYAMGFATLLSFPYLQKMVGGSDAHQYAVIGTMLGVVAAVMTLICGLLTKERLKPKRAEKAISGSLIALFLGWAGANMITDKMGNTVIDPTSITDSVLMMVWSLFSLFPAVIAFLLMVLSYKFPIKK